VKKTLATAAIAAAFVTPAAHAQSNITLYGNLDGGVAFFNNVGGKHLYTTEDGNYIPNLFGLRGSEDLGGGLHAIFNLEAGYLLNSGSLTVPNQLFQRAAMVGLKSDSLGKLTLGHQPSFMFDILSPYSTGYLAGSFYSFHQGNFDELANTFEFNNSVKYLSTSYGGFSAGAQFGFGNKAGNFANGRNYAFTLQYQGNGLSAGAVYANENDRYLELANLVGLQSLLGTPLPAAGIVANKVENWGVGASYAIESWLLHALFTQSRITTPTGRGNANTTDFGVNYTFSPSETVGVGAAIEHFDGGNWATVTLSNGYSLSKRTTLYQQVLYQKASGANAVAAMLGAGQSSSHSQFGVVLGIQHWF